MSRAGIVTGYQLNGKLKSSIKKIKKIRMKYQYQNSEKNAGNLQISGLMYKKKNLKDWVLWEIGRIIIQQ